MRINQHLATVQNREDHCIYRAFLYLSIWRVYTRSRGDQDIRAAEESHVLDVRASGSARLILVESARLGFP